MKVVGVDGCRGGWVAVVLEGGKFAEARFFPRLASIAANYPEATAIGVDTPIGLPDSPPRATDEAAREFLQGQPGAVVFDTYPREFYEQRTREAAFALSQERGWRWSPFSYPLGPRILEVERERDGRVFEVHPEVSFRELARNPVVPSKKTWTGFMRRYALLQGVAPLPSGLGATPLIDTLDAAVAAWSASRYAECRALPLPAGAKKGQLGVIWR